MRHTFFLFFQNNALLLFLSPLSVFASPLARECAGGEGESRQRFSLPICLKEGEFVCLGEGDDPASGRGQGVRGGMWGPCCAFVPDVVVGGRLLTHAVLHICVLLAGLSGTGGDDPD